jgi:hypothetical protein
MFFLCVRDKVSHPYKTTGKISFVYFNLHISRQQTGVRMEKLNKIDPFSAEDGA